MVQGRLAALLELGAGFHPELSGRENVEIDGLLLGLSAQEIAARFDAIVRFAELEEFLDAPLRTYSSGMAVRLGFSIAAHSDPDVLLVDEVLAVGDEAFAHRSLEKFAEFERAGKTILLVSHDLALVAERCRRAIWLDGGRRRRRRARAAETVARYREAVAQAEGEKRLDRRGVATPANRDRAPELDRIRTRADPPAAACSTGRAGPRAALRSGEPAALEMDVRAAETLCRLRLRVRDLDRRRDRSSSDRTRSIDGLAAASTSRARGACASRSPPSRSPRASTPLDAAVHAARRRALRLPARRAALRGDGGHARRPASGARSGGGRFEGPIRWKP